MTPEDFKARRKRLGMTQKQFADALGWSAQHISNLETGHSVIENPTLLNLALSYLELTQTATPKLNAQILAAVHRNREKAKG